LARTFVAVAGVRQDALEHYVGLDSVFYEDSVPGLRVTASALAIAESFEEKMMRSMVFRCCLRSDFEWGRLQQLAYRIA